METKSHAGEAKGVGLPEEMEPTVRLAIQVADHHLAGAPMEKRRALCRAILNIAEIATREGAKIGSQHKFAAEFAEKLVGNLRTEPAYPDLLKRVEFLTSALNAARGAIASLDKNALGGHEASHPEDEEYFFRDELLAHIDAALAEAKP